MSEKKLNRNRNYAAGSVEIAKYSGFCLGVDHAVNAAYKLIERHRVSCSDLSQDEKPMLYMYGELIHNRQVVDDLKEKGMHLASTIDEIASGSTVLIRAHGVPQKEKDALERKSCKVIDKTCGYVKKIQRLAHKSYLEGKQIILTGNPKHPEIIGIQGACEESAYVISTLEDAKKLEFFQKSCVLMSQTTFSVSVFYEICDFLQKKFDQLLIFDTICNATEKRQMEALSLAKRSELMLIIGSGHSSNTKKLFDLCRGTCGETYLVETVCDARNLWQKQIFAGKVCGIVAGASTPESLIMEVVEVMSDEKQVVNEEQVITPADAVEQVQDETVELSQTNEVKDVAEVSEPVATDDAAEGDISFTDFIDSIPHLKRGEIVEGVIVRCDQEYAYVDVRDKSEGRIPMREFINNPDFDLEKAIEERQPIEVYVRSIRNTDLGKEILLSKARVDLNKCKGVLEEAFKSKTPVTVKVVNVVKDGVIATYGGADIYIHRTQLEMQVVKDLEPYRGKTLDVMITQFDAEKRRLRISGSRRHLLSQMRKKQAQEVWSNLEVGDVYEGVVRNITAFGAFVDIGGVDGLVHISELSWQRIKHPSEVVNLGDRLEVYVKDFDADKKRISLGCRRAENDPYRDIETRFPVGSIVQGKVVRMFNFGAFVEIAEGVDALCHISQISSMRLNRPEEVLKEGMVVDARVFDVSNESRRISISIKDVEPIDTPLDPAKAAEMKKAEETPSSYRDDNGEGADINIVLPEDEATDAENA